MEQISQKISSWSTVTGMHFRLPKKRDRFGCLSGHFNRAFGYPFEAATDIAFEAVRGMLSDLQQVRMIRFVLFSGRDYWVYEEKLKALEE